MRDRAMVGLIFHTIIVVMWVAFLAVLAFVWSLGQTIDMTTVALGGEKWGYIMGAVIQLGPSVFLGLASISDTANQRLMWKGAFWLFSGIDALTNVGALASQYSLSSPGTLHVIVGMSVAVAIVFAEEVMAFGLVILADNLARLWKGWGGTPPDWLFATSKTLASVSTQALVASDPPASQAKKKSRDLPVGPPLRDLAGNTVAEAYSRNDGGRDRPGRLPAPLPRRSGGSTRPREHTHT